MQSLVFGLRPLIFDLRIWVDDNKRQPKTKDQRPKAKGHDINKFNE